MENKEKTECCFCKKPAINKKVRCINCNKYFHQSCSIKKTKNCCEKQNFEEINLIITPINEEPDNILNDPQSENVITRENKILKEINNELREHIKLLKEKVINLEAENAEYKERHYNKNKPTQKIEEEHTSLSEIVKSTCEKQLKSVKEQINNLNIQIINLCKERNNPTTNTEQKNNTNPEKILTQPNKQHIDETKKRTPKNYTSQNNETNKNPTPKHEDGELEETEATEPEDNDFRYTRSQRRHEKRHNRNRIVAEGDESTSAEETKFKGIEKRVWLLISRVKRDVNETDIKQFLNSKPGYDKTDFVIKEIDSDIPQKNFMFGAPFDMKNEVYSKTFWPKGVGIERFNFRKHFENKQNKQINATQQPSSFL